MVTTDTVEIGGTEFLTYLGVAHQMGIKKSSLYSIVNSGRLKNVHHPSYGKLFLKEWIMEYFSDPKNGAAYLRDKKRRKAERLANKG